MLLLDLTVAYLAARRHKTKSEAHKRFVKRLKENLFKLCDDIRNWTYVIAPSIYFIQMNPIQREVFAGNFRDRIVHHLIYNYIYPYRDKQFIYDSYSCREGKWTSMGVERIAKFCRSSTDCYTKEAWIMKLDIQWYFMSIDRAILRKKVNDYLSNRENLPWNTPKTKDDTSEIDNL